MKSSLLALLLLSTLTVSCAHGIKTAHDSDKAPASTAASATPRPTGSVSDSTFDEPHTKAALKRAHPTEDLKKVTAETKPHESADPNLVVAPVPVVGEAPAPGTKAIAVDLGGEDKLQAIPDETAGDVAAPTAAAPVGADVELKPAPEASEAAVAAQPAQVAAHAEPKAKLTGIPAEQSLKWLANGNTRYVTKHFRGDGRQQADRDRTAKGQHPHAIILSCADSRVPPELIFDQGLGEIFTVRVAGEVADPGVIASVEYAVEHLGVRLIVVMGHTSCGAVDSAIKTKDGESAGSEALDKLLADIRPHLKTRENKTPSANLEIESTLNADGVARDLIDRSVIIKARVDSGELTIKPALYWIDSGKVKFF